MNKISILGFAGSLRKGSFNKAILRAAMKLLPENAELDIFDLEGIPLFNQDNENNYPQKVLDFKAKIKAADAILISTPEYNYSIPGVLKNAIDCASRPYGDNAFKGKAVAIMGASIGMLGTSRAQYHLRQSFVFLDVYTVNSPEVMVPFAADKVDTEGNLSDPKTKDLIAELLKSLADLALRQKGYGHIAKAA